MNLLEDIQKDAIDASSDLGSLMRKCKVLAARLKSKELEDWLIWESNGYSDNVPVPEYRIWSLEIKGHFAGAFGSGLRDAPIPIISLPEEAQDYYNAYEFRMSIGAVESALKDYKNGMIQISTGDLAVRLGMNVYRDMNCLQCWAEFSRANLDELFNAVRERVLDFSLALWKEYPNAGEVNPDTSESISSDRVTQIFSTKIYGGNTNLTGTANNSPITLNITSNDFDAVSYVLKNNGLSDKDLAELQSALSADKPPQKTGQFGPKVSSWIAKMMKKAAEGTWNIAIGTAGNLLASTISKYYGL
ncbi:MAG: hypothetical protein OXI43_12590 [Candidatus Poribacteria bacterium]|nr:hypothetical protein [Candidatus Poribacteria bacterium]